MLSGPSTEASKLSSQVMNANCPLQHSSPTQRPEIMMVTTPKTSQISNQFLNSLKDQPNPQCHSNGTTEASMSTSSHSQPRILCNELITYPGAIETADDLGVHFHHVPDGIYDRGGLKDNIIEAKQVVEKMLFYAERYPNKARCSYIQHGQQHRIEVELEAAYKPDRTSNLLSRRRSS